MVVNSVNAAEERQSCMRNLISFLALREKEAIQNKNNRDRKNVLFFSCEKDQLFCLLVEIVCTARGEEAADLFTRTLYYGSIQTGLTKMAEEIASDLSGQKGQQEVSISGLWKVIEESGPYTEKIFEEIGIDNREDLMEEKVQVSIGPDPDSENVSFSLALLADTYEKSVNPHVNALLSELKKTLISERCETGGEDFCLILQGMAASFYLLKRQLMDIVTVTRKDRRIQKPEKIQQEGESLLKTGTVRHLITARNGAGLRLLLEDGKEDIYLAFDTGEPIVPGRIYQIEAAEEMDETDSSCSQMTYRMPVYLEDDWLDTYVSRDSDGKIQDCRPLQEVTGIDTGQTHTVIMGFSMDICERLFLHVRPFDLVNQTEGDSLQSFLLTKEG